jgi:hypothetical protein
LSTTPPLLVAPPDAVALLLDAPPDAGALLLDAPPDADALLLDAPPDADAPLDAAADPPVPAPPESFEQPASESASAASNAVNR